MAANPNKWSYNKTLYEVQKLANNSAKTIQELVNSSNEKQMQFNKTEAQTARNWEQMMSDTSHQREVSDLKKAGLNPVLSVNQGAQSYTTSAASTNNDSGASATAAILEGQLGAMTNLESARMSTEAQLKASQQQAAAMRYAAQQSAAAQRYAASQQAAASIYHSNVQNEMNKRSTEAQKWISTNKQPSSMFGFIDKQLSQTGGNKLIKKLGKAFFGKLEAAYKNPGTIFKNSGNITKSNFKLNKTGRGMFDAIVRKAGLPATVENRRLAVRVYMFQDKSALKKFNNRIQANKVPSVTPHHGYTTVQRRGHR